MRAALAAVLFLFAFSGNAQEWAELLERAERERKPIVVFHRAADCPRCAEVENVVLAHPMIARRLPQVVFGIAPAARGERSHVAFYDRGGTLRARWPIVPDTTNFGIILDSVAAVAPHFDCAVELSAGGAPGAAELEVALGLARLGRKTDARAALARAEALGARTSVPRRATAAAPAPRILRPETRETADEPFRLRLTAPAEGPAGGEVRVAMDVRAPAAARVVISWNDTERAVLTAPPWETTIAVPHGEVGVVRAVAQLADGRSTEDAVLLNAGGMAGEVSVQLVELPVTILGRAGPVKPEDIVVREGNLVRPVQTVAGAGETPLTAGLLIDVSASMQKTLPDLQEAAIRFVQTALRDGDRAFLVAFDTHARLLQPATSDVQRLAREIMRIQPEGATSLHDAVILGLQQFAGVQGRRALIVFSDGLDVTSEHGPGDVRERARRMNVPVHVIESVPSGAPNAELQRVARATGGTAHALRTLGELSGVYAAIDAALRAQWLAVFRTDPATHGDEWRAVRVEVKGAEVHAPDGYYARP